MEIAWLNGLVAKKQENFFLPHELAELVQPELDRVGKKRKWMFYAAALLSFMERKPEERSERIGRIAAADTSGFGPLIQQLPRQKPKTKFTPSLVPTDATLPPQPPPARSRRQSRKGDGHPAPKG